MMLVFCYIFHMAYTFLFIFFFTAVSFAQQPAIKPTTLAFWNATNNLTGACDTWITHYQIRNIPKNDPLYAKLETPEVAKRVKDAILVKWAAEIEKTFTEKEIIYLTQLFSHALMKKSMDFDVGFWSNNNLAPLLREVAMAKPPPTKPVAPAAKVPAPVPAPKK